MADQTETLRLLLDATSEGLRRELKGADAATERFRRNSEQHFKRVDRSMRAVDDAAGLLKKGLGALGVAMSARALSSFAQDAIASADALAKTSAQLGVTAERLQELRFGAERSGVATADLDKSMEQFVKRLGEAQAGTGRRTMPRLALLDDGGGVSHGPSLSASPRRRTACR